MKILMYLRKGINCREKCNRATQEPHTLTHKLAWTCGAHRVVPACCGLRPRPPLFQFYAQRTCQEPLRARHRYREAPLSIYIVVERWQSDLDQYGVYPPIWIRREGGIIGLTVLPSHEK